jgi:hypothetical protein
VQPEVQVKNDDSNKGGSPTRSNENRQEYHAIGSFTELLTTSRIDDGHLFDDLI